MDILILGGTGSIGAHVIEFLDDGVNKILVTSRQERESTGYVEYVKGNARDMDFMEEILLKPWDVIVDFMSYGTDEFNSRLDALLGATKQYVFMSSARVYSESKGSIKENTPRLLESLEDKEYLKTDEYALAKARQENLLYHSGRQNWTIIRPSITFSESRMQLGVMEKEAWLYRALKGRSIVFSYDIADKLTTITYGRDVAKGICAIVGNQNSFGEKFHITSSEAFAWKDIFEVYLEVIERKLGSRPRVVMVDKSPNLNFGKYQVIYSRYFNRKFDNAKIAKFVDVESFGKPKEDLKRCMEVFLETPRFRNMNWKLEAVNDRLAKEYTPLKEIPTFKNKAVYTAERFQISFVLDFLRKLRRRFR